MQSYKLNIANYPNVGHCYTNTYQTTLFINQYTNVVDLLLSRLARTLSSGSGGPGQKKSGLSANIKVAVRVR